jgi:hypothetical protein
MKFARGYAVAGRGVVVGAFDAKSFSVDVNAELPHGSFRRVIWSGVPRGTAERWAFRARVWRPFPNLVLLFANQTKDRVHDGEVPA